MIIIIVMEDNTIFLIIIYLVLESFEIFSQKADTLMGMLAKLYASYQKSLLYFISLHVTYLFSLFILVMSEYSTASIILVSLKSIDLALKIKMMQQIFEKKELSEEVSLLLLQKINPMLFLLNFLIYTPLVVLSFYTTSLF